MYGFGIEQDIACAARYLAASALGGFVNALSLALKFHERYPDVELPHWTPGLDGLFQFVLIGPRLGLPKHLEELRILRRLDRGRAQEAVDRINASAFSELGEDHVGNREHDEETFMGPDVQYQWFDSRSMGLFQRLVSSCTPAELISGFRSGLFPTDCRNYNNETAMYMCCRVGGAEAVLSLSDEFDWFRNQTTVATLDGRLPLHYLHAFKPHSVAEIAQTLLRNGANINTTDSFGFRAVDYAVLAGREDVVLCLFDHRKSLRAAHPTFYKARGSFSI